MDSQAGSWFAMRATYGRNMVAQRELDGWNIESFVPLRQLSTKRRGRVKIEFVPVVRDLIFVCSEREALQQAKLRLPYLHYITRPIEGRNVPIMVPQEQMEQFIRFCENGDEVEPLREDIEYNIGERVRITHGALKGMEGNLIKVQGRRIHRFSVAIEGVCTMTIEVRKEEIERVE